MDLLKLQNNRASPADYAPARADPSFPEKPCVFSGRDGGLAVRRIGAETATGIAGRRGFTLIEMLAVMAIMAILMAIAVAAYVDWGRGAAMRGAVLNVQCALINARQWTITYNARTTFTYGNTISPASGSQQGYYTLTNSVQGIIGSTNCLPEGVIFDGTVPDSVTFKLDGSCGGIGTKKIVLKENRANGLTNIISVYMLTGRASVDE